MGLAHANPLLVIKSCDISACAPHTRHKELCTVLQDQNEDYFVLNKKSIFSYIFLSLANWTLNRSSKTLFVIVGVVSVVFLPTPKNTWCKRDSEVQNTGCLHARASSRQSFCCMSIYGPLILFFHRAHGQLPSPTLPLRRFYFPPNVTVFSWMLYCNHRDMELMWQVELSHEGRFCQGCRVLVLQVPEIILLG